MPSGVQLSRPIVGSAAEALAWLLGRSPVVLPLPGTRSIEHLRENLAVLDQAG